MKGFQPVIQRKDYISISRTGSLSAGVTSKFSQQFTEGKILKEKNYNYEKIMKNIDKLNKSFS